jgi:hypothetical protein
MILRDMCTINNSYGLHTLTTTHPTYRMGWHRISMILLYTSFWTESAVARSIFLPSAWRILTVAYLRLLGRAIRRFAHTLFHEAATLRRIVHLRCLIFCRAYRAMLFLHDRITG